jgi:hypothetical protein
MTVCTLPNFSDPTSSTVLLPAPKFWATQLEFLPGFAFRWMLKYAAELPNALQCMQKTSVVISRPIVFATPTLEVDRGEWSP